jgi:uncharacterized integral membrane protein (TIGR00697 family)
MNNPGAAPLHDASGRHLRYYDLIMTAFVVVLLCSNLIGPGKVVALSFLGVPLLFNAGNLFFPISYIFGDVLTEVYGFARSRRVIWAGFGALFFSAFMSSVVVALPPAPDEAFNQVLQPALETVFGTPTSPVTWRIAAGSMAAFWVGDFANSYVLARLKVATEGQHLWARTIGSTIVGQLIDSLVFYPIAFLGTWETSTLLRAMAFNWVFKIAVEVVMTPLTYWVVGTLKAAENLDHFDRNTDFTPFKLAD